MCGIAALLASPLSELDSLQIVRSSLAAVAHRGDPRFQNELASGRGWAGGANRLPFTSGVEPQPAKDAIGRYQIFLNGEIYSLHGARNEAGQPISDTQALAEAILRLGPRQALRSIRGMYALIVIEDASRTAYLARDPFGIKPLYFARTPNGILVGSELKAFVQHPTVDRIEHVPPGALVRISFQGELEQIDQIGLDDLIEDNTSTIDPEALKQALVEAVKEQTYDGHIYGVFLSGGVDSSAIYALAKHAGAHVVPLVLGNAGARDVAAARLMMRYFNDEISHIDCPGEATLFEDVIETIRVCESFEPNVVRQSAVSRILANGARALGCRVVLCGEGADELFGGYPEFWSDGAEFDTIRRRLLRDLPRTQLQRVDRTNMAATIEVRVPFLSPQVARLALSTSNPGAFAASPLGRHAKLPLRFAMRDMLPHEIAFREKVVLSEGAGLRGNNPSTGMFSDLVACIPPLLQVSLEEREEWSLNTVEEIFYFSIFRMLGYDKYKYSRNRVFANSIHTT